MHYRVILRLTLCLAPALLFMSGGALYLLLQSQKGLEQAQQIRFEYTGTANQIQLLSEQLSASIRDYVYTGSERALASYYHTLAVTEGHLARPNGRLLSNAQQLREMMLSREELNLLERARQATLTLARLEAEALRLMESGNHSRARGKVFNADYDRYSDVVSESVGQFISLLQTRLERSIEQQRMQNHYATIAMVILSLLLALAGVGLGWWLCSNEPDGKRLVPGTGCRAGH